MVAQGGIYVSPQVSDRLLERIQKGNLEMEPAPSALAALSPREIQVLRLVAEGKSSKEVAVVLNISVKTAETHRANIMRKLELHSVSELVRYAVKNQIIEV